MTDAIHAYPTRLRTVRDYIRWAVSRFHTEELFFGHGTDNAWDEARQLVLGALHLPYEIADSYLDCRLEDDEHAHLHALLARRIDERVPTAYLLGEAWFCNMPFIVDERVLIPRSPISELIGQHFEPWLAMEPARILDLCTGSGCIGIACAYEFPEAEVVLADLSYEALEVANQNIERHGLDERVYTVQGDGFAGLPGQRFDLIVSNPPYVDAEDFADMPAEYQHEPELGLACGEDGLNLVRRMLAVTGALSILAGLGFALAGAPLAEFLYGDPVVGVYVRHLSAAAPFMYMESMVDGVLKGLGEQLASFRYSLLDSAFRITAILLLLPRCGMGAFLGIMVSREISQALTVQK